MTTPTIVREWNIQGLPRDNFSTENAILATRSLSYSSLHASILLEVNFRFTVIVICKFFFSY